MEWSGTDILRLGAFLGGLVFFLILERTRPYRRPTQSKTRRWIVNLTTTGFNSGLVHLILAGIMAGVFIRVAGQRTGLLNALDWPVWARVAATVVILDFVTYLWHLVNHKLPILWRFHRVHHSDLDMDVSTATRFHAGELLLSGLLRIPVIRISGADPLGVLVFEVALITCTQFHHSSVRIPGWLDRAWLLLFVPPSAHRTHHSVVIKERDSNYGAVFSLWDRALGTLRTDVNQDRLTIGVGAYRDPERLSFLGLLLLPFGGAIR